MCVCVCVCVCVKGRERNRDRERQRDREDKETERELQNWLRRQRRPLSPQDDDPRTRGGSCPIPGCRQQIGASEAAGAGLRTCAKCRRVVYCSRACQKAAWKGGHKQECKELQQERQLQVCRKIQELQSSNKLHKHRDVVKMAEEGLAAAGELRSAMPDFAAMIFCRLGDSFCTLCDHVKGLGLLEQARALAVEAGERSVLRRVCLCLGHYQRGQGKHAKAIVEYELAGEIAVELGYRRGEAIAISGLGLSYMSLKQYDKAVELLEQSWP